MNNEGDDIANDQDHAAAASDPRLQFTRLAITETRPATPTQVRDVCGTGDTVFAALAVTMLTGKSLRAACQWAMEAAGRQVADVGIRAETVAGRIAWC